MRDIDQTVKRYLALWNETDALIRRAAIHEILATDIVYIDPLASVVGHEQFDALITGVQVQFPGFIFGLLGVPDAHHDIVRFTWGLGPAGVEPPVVGFDVAALDSDSRIKHVSGFLDKVPA
ncbi:nuclear transport factor 2 family protein [Embleya sp. NPDC001921]